MNEYIKEIKEFFERKPRFNVVLIKGVQKVKWEKLSKEFNCEIIDIQKLLTKGNLESEIEKINGYTDLLEYLGHLLESVTRPSILLINIDILLSKLNIEKRKSFFENILQKTLPKPLIFTTFIFQKEVPEVNSQIFNYAKVIEWRAENEQ